MSHLFFFMLKETSALSLERQHNFHFFANGPKGEG